MKTLFSLPKDEGFFNRYATLIPTLRKLGGLSQIINAITEVGILYAVTFSMLTEFWGAYAAPLAVFAAIVGVFVIEGGLRKFLPFAARAILHRRWQGLDAWMSGFILVTCLSLFVVSLTLSFRGSKAMVEAAAPAPDTQTTDAPDAALNTGKAEAARTFSRDSGEISARYAALITAQRAAYSARMEAERAALARYQKNAQKYTSLINSGKSKISALEAERAGTVAKLETAKAGEMSDAARRKAADTERVTAHHTTTTAEISAFNTDARTKSEHRTRTYGSGLAWFTLIFHFVLILAVALDEMNLKGSGIEQVAQPNQYHFSEGILAAFTNTMRDKWNYHARTWIQNWADKTPPPPRPTVPPPLYELADWKLYRVTLPTMPQELLEEIQPNGSGHYNEAANGRINGTTAQPINGSSSHNRAANGSAPPDNRGNTGNPATVIMPDAKLPANDPPGGLPEVTKDSPPHLPNGTRVQFRWKNTWTGEVTEGAGAITGSLYNGYYILGDDGLNHYASAHAVTPEPMPNAVPSKARPLNGSVNNGGGFAKICAHCGKDYTAKVNWQKFCTETCKMAFHEAKHGQPFKPKSYHKRQSVTV